MDNSVINIINSSKSKVAIVRCEEYNYEKVLDAVKKGIDLLGGCNAFAKSGEKILLKPNLLSADSPDKASTTHFNVVKAVGEVFKASGALLSYGDSPGLHRPLAAATKNGVAKVMDELSIPLADFENGQEVFFENGFQNKKFTIANGAFESDGIISICKLKTHGLSRLTGAVKNQFGCIPGTLKGQFHARIPDPVDFCRMLVDLNMYLRPRLFVMDAIVAMEGNGPRSGTPRKVNALMFSSDPVALDAVSCKIINLNPEYVPTITLGKKAGLGNYSEHEVDIIGDSLESFFVPTFVVVDKPVKSVAFLGSTVAKFFRKFLLNRPSIDENKCVKCGLCVEVCPVNPKALAQNNYTQNKCENSHCSCSHTQTSSTHTVSTQIPQYDYSRCIRCFCCQELCPHGAIDIKVPFIRRILSKNPMQN